MRVGESAQVVDRERQEVSTGCNGCLQRARVDAPDKLLAGFCVGRGAVLAVHVGRRARLIDGSDLSLLLFRIHARR